MSHSNEKYLKLNCFVGTRTMSVIIWLHSHFLLKNLKPFYNFYFLFWNMKQCKQKKWAQFVQNALIEHFSHSLPLRNR